MNFICLVIVQLKALKSPAAAAAADIAVVFIIYNCIIVVCAARFLVKSLYLHFGLALNDLRWTR